MTNDRDENLTLEEKLYLIKWIPIRQQERWARMKGFHNMKYLTMDLRHTLMKKEVDLMRSQEIRFKRILHEVFNK